MVKKKLFSLLLLCMGFISTTASAQEANLYLDDAVASPGSEVDLIVKINNTEDAVAGFSCKIYLPDGVEVVKASRGTRLLEKNANEEYITTFQSAQQTDGSFMLLAYGGQPISGVTGEVAKVTISIPANTEFGSYNVNIREIECSVGSTVTSTYTETTSVLTIKEENYDKGYTVCTTPIATTAGAANTIVLNFAGIDEDITDIEFDMEMPACLSRTKNGRVTKAFEGADENRMYVYGTDGDHTITVNGNHVTIAAIADDEYKYIAGTSGALVNMYYTVAAGTTDGVYPINISNITMKNGDGEILKFAPTTSYIKVGNPTGESLTLVGHIAEEVNAALATETALAFVDMNDVVSMDGTLALTDGRSYIWPEKAVQVSEVTYNLAVSASLGYKTLVLPFDWSVPVSHNAYEVTGVNNGELEMSQVYAVSANTPVIVENAGSALINATNVTIAASGAALTCGELIGTYEKMNAPTGSYVLQNQGGEVAFYLVGEEVHPAVGAFRAYLKGSNGGARRFALRPGVATSISNVNADSSNEYYNLEGQRVAKSQRGINIIRSNDGVKKIVAP